MLTLGCRYCKFLIFLNFFLNDIAGFQIPAGTSVVDFSWKYDENTLTFPGMQPFHFVKEVFKQDGDNWFAVKEFCMGEHAGTHLDAPYHFYKEGLKTGDLNPQNFIVPGSIVDVSELVGDNRSFHLESHHLEAWEAENGSFPNNSVILIRFGWSRFWPNAQQYFGTQENGSLSYPGLSASAASWIVNKKTIVGVGVDVGSLDPGYSTDFPVHRILTRSNIYGIENVNLKSNLPGRDFTVVVAPMNIAQGTGGPCRIFGLF